MNTKLLLMVSVFLAIAATTTGIVYLSTIGNPVPEAIKTGVKPGATFLIIAGENGFNDSVYQGGLLDPWPWIKVAKGTVVKFTVTNQDSLPHGFQIEHYFDDSIHTLYPGQTISVTFVADKVGSFEINCSIFCPIHLNMQTGQFNVS